MKLDFHNGQVIDEKYQDCPDCDSIPLFDDFDYCPYCGVEL